MYRRECLEKMLTDIYFYTKHALQNKKPEMHVLISIVMYLHIILYYFYILLFLYIYLYICLECAGSTKILSSPS